MTARKSSASTSRKSTRSTTRSEPQGRASTAQRPAAWTADDLGFAGDPGALEHYADPRYYDHAYRDRAHDVAWYLTLAQRLGGPVLEYGAGNGRVSLALARAGIDVVALDLSKPMLASLVERLRSEAPAVRRRVRAVYGDMVSHMLRRRFPLVIAPFNVVLHLYTPDEISGFLARVRAHLAPKGTFAFDFSLPQPEDLARDPKRRYRAPRFRHPSTGKLVRYAERFEYDHLRQLLTVWMEFAPEVGEPWTVPLTHRQFFPQEMRGWLRGAGFSDVRYTADFTASAPDALVDSLVVQARLARQTRF